MEWILARLASGWDRIESVAAWSDSHVLASVFFGFLLREIVRYAVKKTPTRYDDLCLEIVENALRSAWERVRAARDLSGRRQ